MERKPRALEFKVGLFALTGFLVIAAMTIWFGRLGQGFKKYYPVTIEFPDAGGIIRNSDVRLAGARVGFVATSPAITRTVDGVVFDVHVNEGLRIPKKSRFLIGSSGLLGDRFVEILPSPEFDASTFNPDDPAQVLQPGDRVKGEKAGGIDELAKKGAIVLDNLNEEITALREVTARVNDGVLSETNIGNLEGTLASFKKASDDLAESSAAVHRLVDRGQEVIGSIHTTADNTGKAAEDLRVALADARKLIEATRGTLKQFEPGQGPIAALLRDPKLTADLKALLSNLREKGILFYRDMATRESKKKERGQPGE